MAYWSLLYIPRVHTDEGKKPGGNVWALSTFPTWDNNPNPKQGRKRRQLFHPFGDSSVRRNKQRGSASKFPHTPFQSSDIKLKRTESHHIISRVSCTISYAEFSVSTQCLFFLVRSFIDPTFCGILVCGHLQLNVNLSLSHPEAEYFIMRASITIQYLKREAQ